MLKTVHNPVLVREIIKYFSEIKIKIFIDGTMGAGGHAKQLLESCLLPDCIYAGFDQDGEILTMAKENLRKYKDRTFFINKNYSEMKTELNRININNIDGLLLDLGVSSYQFDSADRGFGFKNEAPLDMRMDQRNDLTAYDVVNGYPEEELLRVFYDYSDIPKPREYVRKIVQQRTVNPIRTTKELADLFVYKKNSGRFSNKKIHPATEVFQAVRIEVNNELNCLKTGLADGFSLLNSKGYMAVISFHSLEDRIVKNFFRDKAAACICPKELPECVCGNKSKAIIHTKKPVCPQEDEVLENPRSRSAKLRILEKI